MSDHLIGAVFGVWTKDEVLWSVVVITGRLSEYVHTTYWTDVDGEVGVVYQYPTRTIDEHISSKRWRRLE